MSQYDYPASDYKILSACSPTILEKMIKDHIDIGWQPHGSLQVILYDGTIKLFQPVVHVFFPVKI